MSPLLGLSNVSRSRDAIKLQRTDGITVLRSVSLSTRDRRVVPTAYATMMNVSSITPDQETATTPDPIPKPLHQTGVATWFKRPLNQQLPG